MLAGEVVSIVLEDRVVSVVSGHLVGVVGVAAEQLLLVHSTLTFTPTTAILFVDR